MPEKRPTLTRRQAYVLRTKRRAIERRHACSRCHQVFGCDACSVAASQSAQRLNKGKQYSCGVALYDVNAGKKEHFICDDCRKPRRQ